jgi:DNA-binding CsgD family transcriptional regulator
MRRMSHHRQHPASARARALYLSEATVKSHVARVLAKLDLRDRVQIAVFAYENGIVRPGHRDGRNGPPPG